MYTLETSPEFKFFASSRYGPDEFESLGNGWFKLDLVKLPEVFKNMIRKYNEDKLVARIRSYAEKKGWQIGPVAFGPDILWIVESSFPASHPKSRCHVLLAVAPPTQPEYLAVNNPTVLTIQSAKDGSKIAEVEWHVGHVYMLEEGEVAKVHNGGFAFIGIQYGTRTMK
ncbi:hypothetical protein F5Y08DRAFT_103346 [Xylaria arbuscula]|nr:hypothetical protein F5Y08DRAFT_103346 [Xylaria arbuscula]